MTMDHELRDLNATNNLGVLLKGMVLGRQLRALDVMSNSRLEMTELLSIVSSSLWML